MCCAALELLQPHGWSHGDRLLNRLALPAFSTATHPVRPHRTGGGKSVAANPGFAARHRIDHNRWAAVTARARQSARRLPGTSPAVGRSQPVWQVAAPLTAPQPGARPTRRWQGTAWRALQLHDVCQLHERWHVLGTSHGHLVSVGIGRLLVPGAHAAVLIPLGRGFFR